MNCINCYKEIPEDTNFCPYCGAQQAAPASAPEAPVQPAAAPIPDAPVQSDSAAPTPEALAQPEAAAPAPEAPVQPEAAMAASEASGQPEAAATPEAPVQPEAATPTPEEPVQQEYSQAEYSQAEYSQPIYNQPDVNYGQQLDYGQVQTQYSQEPAVNWVPYLVFSILCTILCCMPFGVVAIVFAAKINSALSAGNIAEAKDCAKKSKIWIIVSAVVGLVAIILAIIWALFIGISVGTATYYY